MFWLFPELFGEFWGFSSCQKSKQTELEKLAKWRWVNSFLTYPIVLCLYFIWSLDKTPVFTCCKPKSKSKKAVTWTILKHNNYFYHFWKPCIIFVTKFTFLFHCWVLLRFFPLIWYSIDCFESQYSIVSFTTLLVIWESLSSHYFLFLFHSTSSWSFDPISVKKTSYINWTNS